MRILIAEDAPSNQEVARVILTLAGHEVTLVDNGEDVVRLCIEEGRRFDLILMDIIMPRLYGDEAAQRLKAHELTRGIPIVCCSAQTRPEEVAAAFRAGCLAYVTKPYRRSELLAAIDEAIKRQAKLDNPNR